MKRMKIIVAMALVCLMVLSAAGAGAAGWQSGSRGWWYENTDGSYPANQWQRIDGDWYYFDASGWMVTGWKKISGSWYYFSNSGAMQTGWKKISGSWYYFESSGAMMTGWQRIDEQYYYFDGSGVMQTGWIEDGGKQYYLDENGVWVDGGEEQTGGPTYSNAGYWGRATLENDNLRAAYDRIWLGIEQMEKSIDLRSYKLSYSQFSNVMSTYEMEHGEHFWYANEYYYYTSGGIVTKVEPAYYSFSDLAAAKAAFNSAISAMVVTSGSDYQKELKMHDTLLQRVRYTEGANAHNAYGAAVEGRAVCEGYAEAYLCMLQKAGIRSIMVSGEATNSFGQTESHRWIIAWIDGQPYHVDPTWNDSDGEIYHCYFNMTTAMISADHRATSRMPSCTATSAYYFAGKEITGDQLTVNYLIQLMKENGGTAEVCFSENYQVSDVVDWFYNVVKDIASGLGYRGSYSYGYSVKGREYHFSVSR